MKESIKKIFAILVLFLLIINSSFLMVVSTAIDAIEKLIDENKINQIIEVNLEKYVNYKISDESKGTLLQTNVKTGIEYEEGEEYTPIKATKTVINLPQIDGKYPESLEVIAKSTKATNGDSNGKDMYYSYDKETGKLEIVVDNKEDENGNIYTESVNGARDEFVVISNYGADCYNGENVKRDLSITGTIEEILANEDTTKLTKDWKINFEVTENVSGLISTEVVTSDIYNGYINSNKENGTQNATEYTENMKINVSYKEISEEMTVETSNKFINTESEEVETEDIVYRGAKVNKQNVLDILGEEGNLQILNKTGEVIGEINKDTEAQEDGTVEINYENEQTEIIVKTTKPVKLGTIGIESKKAIKETMTEIENNKISVKNTIKCVNNVQEKDEETGKITREYTEEIYNFENTKEIEIKQSETKIDISLDKTEWTNNAQNEVTFTATLVSNGPQYNLFKNPVIEIKLPEEVEKVILGDTSLLYDSNLSVTNAQVLDKGTNKVIRIEIAGTQSEYVTSEVYSGPEILISATIILNKQIETSDSKLVINYSNESGIVNDYINGGLNYKELEVRLTSKEDEISAYSEEVVTAVQYSEETEDDDENQEEGLNDLSVEIIPQVGSDILNDNDVVYSEEIIKYTVKVTNNSDSTISNIKVVSNVPEGTVYVTEDGSWIWGEGTEYAGRNPLFIEDDEKTEVETNIQSLASGETYQDEFIVNVKDIEEETSKQIIINSIVYKNNKNVGEDSNILTAQPAEMSIRVWPRDEEISLETSHMSLYFISVDKLISDTIYNATIEINIPKEYNFYYLTGVEEEDYEYDEENSILKVYLGDLDEEEPSKTIQIRVGADNFEDGKYEYNIAFSAIAYGNDTQIYRSNQQGETVNYAEITVVQTSETEGEDLKAGQEIVYSAEVKNIGKERALINIIDNLPEGITGIEANYEIYKYIEESQKYEKIEETQDMSIKIEGDENDFCEETFVYPDETLTVTIKAKVDYITTFREIENIFTVNGSNITTKVSNVIKNRILPWGYEEPENPDIPDNPDTPENPDNPDEPNNPDNPESTYSISGIAWLDSNKNGQRDNDEQLLEGITVKLFNAETNAIVSDNNGNIYRTTTSGNGEYNFTNIEHGKYLVLFEYDTDKYELTAYKKSAISSELNSDAVLKEVSIDGNIKNVGITDTLIINDKNLTNIDIGLVENNILDISIEKYVSKITVENDNGSQEYTYDNSKLAKVEIPSKLVENTNISIEYTLVITNNGNVDAYVTEILDNMPDEFIFDGSENQGWDNANQKIANKTLAGIPIKPGENKEITIILSKDLSQEDTGRIVNNAEIVNIYNSYNLKDENSENNKSEAEVIISIKTGTTSQIVLLIVLTIIILVVLFIVIKNKKYTFALSFAFIAIFILLSGAKIAIAAGSACYKNDGDVAVYEGDLYAAKKDGIWKLQHSDGKYICIDPGQHLGTSSQCPGGDGHHYTISKTGQPYTSLSQLVQAFPKLAEGDVSGVFSRLFTTTKEEDIYMNTDQTEKDITIKEPTIKNDNFIVGPFKYSYSTNLSDVTETRTPNVSYKNEDGTYGTSYNFCDSEGNTKDYTPTNGEEFYVSVPTSAEEVYISIDVNISAEIITSSYIIGKGATFVGIPKGMFCYHHNDTTRTVSTAIGYNYITVDGKHEYKSPESWRYGSQTGTIQQLIEIEPKTTTKTVTKEHKFEWNCKIQLTEITVYKTDYDTGAPLPGAKIKLTGPNNYDSGEVTMDSGSYTFKHLLEGGTYTVTEVGAPSGYDINLQTDKTKTIYVDAGESKAVTITNRQYGSFKIQKTDEDTGKAINAKGFTFKIYTLNGNTKNYISSYTSGSPSSVSFTTNENAAKVFSTDANGIIQLNNIPIHPDTYYIQEVGVAPSLQDYYKVREDVLAVKVENNTTTVVTYGELSNKQIWTDISGYVWEDTTDGSKIELKNALYDSGKETLAKDVTVRIIDSTTGNVLVNDNGVRCETKTDSNGAYKFNKLRIDSLSNYYIQYEYNGLKYADVEKRLEFSNGSKAIEKQDDRTNFNNSFSSITGGNAKGDSETIGYSKNENGTITNNLTYKNEAQYKSSLIQNTEYSLESTNGIVTAQNGSVGAKMNADTKTAGVNFNTIINSDSARQQVPRTITNINLGLQLREQPDMAIIADLNSVGLTLNGYTHTYMYDQRAQAQEKGIDIYSEMEKWNKTAQEQEAEGYPSTYTRSIYKNYIYASGITGEGKLKDEDKLQVYLTYKILVKNESSSLYMSANEIVNYYDTTLELVESWYEDYDGNKVNITWTSKGQKNGYNEMRTTSLKDVKIEHGQSITIYVKTKKTDDTIINWSKQKELDEKTRNVTEITSYSSYTKSENNYLHYAGIDKDSAPDNIIPGVGQDYVKRYEDDTDSAPLLDITFDYPRTISGYVFEDVAEFEDKSDERELHTGEERIGDGKYDASKDGYVGNVKVELINVSNGNRAYIYPDAVTTLELNDAKEAEYTTTKEENGYYEFVGVMPGEYYIKYTYGDGSVIYKKAGGTVNVTTQDYKSTIITSDEIKNAVGNINFEVTKNTKWYQNNNIKGYSAAVDDYETRVDINDALETVTYGVKAEYEKGKDGNYTGLQTMTARTLNMNIAIENTNGETTIKDENRTSLYDNINFGIIERPRMSVETTKEISYIKLILANGQVLVEGDPRNRNDPIRYVIYPEGGSLKIEVDNEIIEGATLEVTYEIKVENKSELDYDTEVYYKYGDKTGASPVVMTINSVIDHMDENVKTTYTYDGEKGEWKIVNPGKDLYDKGLISKDVYNDIKTNNSVLVNECDLILNPGENKTIEVSASKLLSTSKEMIYNNYAEVLTLSNSVGRFYGQKNEGSGNKWKLTTPGNFDPTNPDDTSEDDNNRGRRAELSIIPPTGQNGNKYVIGSIIGVISLSILVGEIVLIKKKILR